MEKLDGRLWSEAYSSGISDAVGWIYQHALDAGLLKLVDEEIYYRVTHVSSVTEGVSEIVRLKYTGKRIKEIWANSREKIAWEIEKYGISGIRFLDKGVLIRIHVHEHKYEAESHGLRYDDFEKLFFEYHNITRIYRGLINKENEMKKTETAKIRQGGMMKIKNKNSNQGGGR